MRATRPLIAFLICALLSGCAGQRVLPADVAARLHVDCRGQASASPTVIL